jgi:DNA primase
MSITDEIKTRLDIVTYIQQYAVLKKAGRYYKACCPFHAEKTPSFVVNPDTQSWRCFGACAEGGDIFNFAIKQHGWTFSEALQELGRQAGVEVRQQTPEQRQQIEKLDVLRGLLTAAAEIYHRNLTAAGDTVALRYARDKRGFSDETITKFMVGFALPGWNHLHDELVQLGYSEDQMLDAGVVIKNDKGSIYDRFRNRLMIPICDERGRVVGFGARALDPDDNPKYLNSPQSMIFDKSHTLFGLDTARAAIRDSETAVIVEGYMDAIQAQQAGFNNVVAQMGTAMTETQLNLIAPRWAKRIILALDSDAAGQSATLRSLEVARQTLQADYAGRLSVDIRILQIPGAKDPDDLIRESPDQWQVLVEKAMPVAEYVIEMETASLPQNPTVQEREAVARRVLPILTASENDLYRKDNLQKLALKLRIAERDLLMWAQARKNMALPNIEIHEAAPTPPTLQGARLTLKEPDAALEAYCLRRLLMNPDFLYTANRKFRELAGNIPDLSRGPLNELSVEDFQRTDYRALMQFFRIAVKQDEVDIHTFLRENLDPALVDELNKLSIEESDEVYKRLGKRFYGDAVASWSQHERRVMAYINPELEFLDKVLRLRLHRLQRESQEVQFLQADAQNHADDENRAAYMQHVRLSIHAKRLIEAELKKQSANLI